MALELCFEPFIATFNAKFIDSIGSSSRSAQHRPQYIDPMNNSERLFGLYRVKNVTLF